MSVMTALAGVFHRRRPVDLGLDDDTVRLPDWSPYPRPIHLTFTPEQIEDFRNWLASLNSPDPAGILTREPKEGR